MLIRTSLLALDQAARLQFNIGDGLDLWLDDRRLGLRRDDRDIKLRLTGESIPENLLAVHVRGQIGSTSVDASYVPEPNLFFAHNWDGTTPVADAPGTPANSLSTEIEIGWELAADFPRPARIKWWRRSVVTGGIDLRHLGCGGITPDVVHHLDVNADILWRGNGSRVTNARRNDPSHLRRLKIASNEIGVADQAFAHVFDANGTFKRTISSLKGTTVAGARIDELGRVTSWTSGRHRYTIDRRNDHEALLRSPAGVWAVIDFDDHGRAIAVTDQDSSKAALEWADAGGLASITDSAGLVTEIDRDELGRVIAFRDSTGRSLSLVRTEFETGSQVTVVTAEGRESTHRNERLIDGTYVESHSCCGASTPRIVEHRNLGPLGEERVVRSPDGSVSTIKTSNTATDNSSIDVVRTSIAAPSGRTMSVERRTERYLGGRTDEHLTIGSSTSKKRLDPKQHRTTSVSAEGRESTATLSPGKSLVITSPTSGTLTIEFDDLARAKRRIHNDDVMTYGYDQNGRLTWSDFERWRQQIHHDEQGHVSAIETPDGWMQFARDAAGRVIAVKAPGNAVTSMNRRPDGQISSIDYPETDQGRSTEEFNYDRDGLLVHRSFDGTHEIEYRRDSAGRVVSATAGETQIVADYDDASGQLTDVVTAVDDRVTYQHDGDIEWCEEAFGRTPGRIERAFDDSHRVAARRVNGGHELHYGRDGDGLIINVGPLQIERNSSAGLPVAMRLGGLTTSREYDAKGRLSRHETRFGKMAGIYFSEELERDDFGRVVRITEHSQGRDRVITYTYNDERRLAQVDVDGTTTLTLDYDVNGNIVNLERQGRALALETNAADQLVRVANEPTQHDAAGNFIGIGDNASVRRYHFDGLGRLTGSVDPHGAVTHVLDALGRPIEVSSVGQSKLRMVWDGSRLAATLDVRNNVDMRFIDSGMGAAPEGLLRDGVEYLLITDHLGSVRRVVDAREGEVVQALDYDALGRPTTNTSPGWQPFGFAGGLHEPASGLVRFRARTYDPFIGRFLSRDPLGFAGGQVNLYQYALGDPINYVDPSGLQAGPTGEVSVCSDPFIGARPLSIDHMYLKSEPWRQGMQPVTDLGAVGQLTTEWAMEPADSDPQCRKVFSADLACLDQATSTGSTVATYGADNGGVMAWAHGDACYDSVWEALDSCAGPDGWEFRNGPSRQLLPIGAVTKMMQVPARLQRLLPNAEQHLSQYIDGFFD